MIQIVETTKTSYGASEQYVILRKNDVIDGVLLSLVEHAPIVGHMRWVLYQQEYVKSDVLGYAVSWDGLKRVSGTDTVELNSLRVCYNLMREARVLFRQEFPSAHFPLEGVINAFSLEVARLH